jgi:pilus assembly protein FimV
MKNNGRWRIGALASAVALLGSLASLEAQALALGRMTVQSALGEPLRAEVDIADINAEEASSLKAGVAPPEAFKAAGFEYNAVVAAGLEVRLQRRPDGRAYLRLTSSRPVTEPFVDLIIEANWASGRISRDYTLLLDPPNLRARAAPVEPSAAILSQPAVPAAPAIARPQAPAPYSPPAAAAVRPAPPVRALVAKAPPAERMPASDTRLTVKSGDTASKIAAQTKPSSVSLDQMLVALLRSNPDAFIGGNINRIKSGAVLDIPGTQAASAIAASEASQTIFAQSKDFNAFRRKLAGNAPTTQVDSADRQAGGKVQTKVEDRAPANATPDKLTLSKGQVQGKAATADEEKIAKDKEAKAAASRIAELSKNIADLNKLNAAPVAAPAANPPPVSAGITAPAPSSLPVPTPPAVVASSAAPASPKAVASSGSAASTPADSAAVASAPASAAASVVAPLTPASQPAIAASAAAPATPAVIQKPQVSAVTPPPEPGFMDQLLENPLLLPGVAALLALLAGFGFYRYRQNSKKGQVDSSFLESRLQPDSFFGASGGQRIDTNESNVSGSSMAYTSSQLDAAGDVDPVAEADVYLAYGRDLQAEEILKEALRSHPVRVAIHAKLLEIYAKRRDSKAFEGVAMEAFKLTQGYGPEWAHIAEAGRDLDPANPMYQANGTPAANVRTHEAPISVFAAASGLPAEVTPSPLRAVDLDLDFSLDDQPEMATAPAAISVSFPYELSPAAPVQDKESVLPASLRDLDLDLDFGHATAALPGVSAPAHHPLVSSAPASRNTDFASEGMDFTPEPFTAPLPLTASGTYPAATADSGMLEFDMSSLSLDLGPITQATGPAATDNGEDPLEIKFLLAEEFRTLGDPDGARSLADEVLAKASGPLKAKAQAFLNALS